MSYDDDQDDLVEGTRRIEELEDQLLSAHNEIDHLREDRVVRWVCKTCGGLHIMDDHRNALIKRQAKKLAMLSDASTGIGMWISAAFSDPKVCADMKSDLNTWLIAIAEAEE